MGTRVNSASIGRAALASGIAGVLAACTAPNSAGTSPSAVDPDPALGLGVELYPAGVIGKATAELALTDRESVVVRALWNAADRGDFGRHDDEDGGGAGGGAGWRRYTGSGREGFFVGLRADLSWLSIDWKDDPPNADRGDSDVLVFQPTLEGGWRLRFGASGLALELLAGLGYEWNLITDGKHVGDGPIGLVGLGLTYGR